jgi:hypothetical protein
VGASSARPGAAAALSQPNIVAIHDFGSHERFIVIKEDRSETGRINVVPNWFEELERRIAPLAGFETRARRLYEAGPPALLEDARGALRRE